IRVSSSLSSVVARARDAGARMAGRGGRCQAGATSLTRGATRRHNTGPPENTTPRIAVTPRRVTMPESKLPAGRPGARKGAPGQPLLREIAYTRIKEAIRAGELAPGQPLSEARLSEAFQISRTPVREALQKLAQEGLVQIHANRTVTVAALSLQEVL